MNNNHNTHIHPIYDPDNNITCLNHINLPTNQTMSAVILIHGPHTPISLWNAQWTQHPYNIITCVLFPQRIHIPADNIPQIHTNQHTPPNENAGYVVHDTYTGTLPTNNQEIVDALRQSIKRMQDTSQTTIIDDLKTAIATLLDQHNVPSHDKYWWIHHGYVYNMPKSIILKNKNQSLGKIHFPHLPNISAQHDPATIEQLKLLPDPWYPNNMIDIYNRLPLHELIIAVPSNPWQGYSEHAKIAQMRRYAHLLSDATYTPNRLNPYQS